MSRIIKSYETEESVHGFFFTGFLCKTVNILDISYFFINIFWISRNLYPAKYGLITRLDIRIFQIFRTLNRADKMERTAMYLWCR